MTLLLPTSTAGSLPKPSWLAEPEKIWSPWTLSGEQLFEAKQDALRVSLQEQQHAGIDDREAYGSLNMGAGFAFYVAAEQAEEVARI